MNKQNYFQKEGEVNSAKRCSAKECSKDRIHTFRTHAFRTDASYSLRLFSCSVVSNSLWPHRLQHARIPYPSPSPGAWSNSCPSTQWCHPTISSSVISFSSCLQSFPASGAFLMIWLFPFRWPKYRSFSFSISPSNEYSGLISFMIDWFDLLADSSQRSSPTSRFKSINSLVLNFMVQLSHPYMTTGKTIALARWTSVSKVTSLLLLCCLGWSQLFFQGPSVFWFHGWSHHLQWFWSPRK